MLLLQRLGDVDALDDEIGNLLEIRLHEPARGERGRAQPQTAGDHRALVPRDGVFVARDVRQLEHALDARAVHAERAQIGQNKVVVRASGHELYAVLLEAVAHRNHVAHHLLLVLGEFGRARLFERHG